MYKNFNFTFKIIKLILDLQSKFLFVNLLGEMKQNN